MDSQTAPVKDWAFRATQSTWGLGLRVRVRTDPSVAQGRCIRIGLGKVRHLAISQLWAQGKLCGGTFSLHKCRGDFNPADMLTKHFDQGKVKQCPAALALRVEPGRAAPAPQFVAEVEAFLAWARGESRRAGAAWPASAGVCRPPGHLWCALCGE